MTGRKLDKKSGRQSEKRRNCNRSHGGTTDPKGIQPSDAFAWSVSESGRGDKQGLEETDKGVSNPNLNHPPVFTFSFQPSFSTSGAERPETKPVVKQTPVTSGFTFPFQPPSTFLPSSTFQPFSPPRAVRPKPKPAAQESSFPSLFTIHQPRQTTRTTGFVFGTARTEQGGMETTARPGEMITDTTQNTGNKEGQEHGDLEETSAANSGGDGHRGNSNTEGNAHGGGRATDGSTDPRDVLVQDSEDQDSNTRMRQGEGTGAQENNADVTEDRNGNETGAARHDPPGDQGKGGHQGGVGRAADPQRETVENGGDTHNIAAGETDPQTTGAKAASPDQGGYDAESECERQPNEKPNTSSNKGALNENGRDLAQDRSPDDADVGIRLSGHVNRDSERQYRNESGTPPPSPLSLLTARPTEHRTPAPSRGFGRGRGRGHAVTPESGMASPDVGGQSSSMIGEILTMLSSVLERLPDRGARRQLFPDESTAGIHDYFSKIHRKYAAIEQLEQQTQQLQVDLAKLEGELREKDKAIGKLQADREGTRREAEKERAALQSQLAERDGVITDLKRKMDHLNDNIQSLENELKTREDYSGSLAKISNLFANEQTRAEQLEREKAALADDMKQLREEHRSMQGCLEERDRTVSSLKLQKLLWKAVVSKQNSSLGECRTRQQQLVAELEKERQARSALETDVANSRRDVSQSEATLREQLDSFARERDYLNSQMEDLTAQLARAREQAESYRTTAEEQTVAVCQLSEVRTDLEAEIATMQERAEVAEMKATRHEQEVNTLTLCRDSLKTQKTVAEEYVMELSRQMAPLQAERAQFQVLYCQKQNELDATTASKDARIEELTAQLSEAERIVLPLKLDAQQANLEAQQARAQLESIQQHFEQYKDEISTGAAALEKAYTLEEQLRSRISEQEDQKKRYLQEKEQSNRQVKLLKDEVERLRRRCQGGDQNQV